MKVEPGHPDFCYLCGGTGLAWHYSSFLPPIFGICGGCSGTGVRVVQPGESRPTFVGTLEHPAFVGTLEYPRG